MNSKTSYLRQTYVDLTADFEELIFLLGGLQERLQKQINYLKRKSRASNQAETLLRRVDSRLGLALEHKRESDKKKADVFELIAYKYSAYEAVRRLTSEVAGLVQADDWQSPSYQSAGVVQAGRYAGMIHGNITDYTRDQHLLGNEAQRQFGQAYLRVSPLSLPRLLFTSSGMAALTTILVHMMREGKLSGNIVVGQHSYFQNQELLVRMFKEKVVLIDEHDVGAYTKIVSEKRPVAVFIDSLTNSPGLAAPALQQWLNILKEQVNQEAYFVVDNTCLALGIPALKGSRKVKVIVWESLNKYYQFGLDRTTGGYIYASGMETLKLFYARMHAGTNMPDTSCSLLPKPQKRILMSRMKRMGRNAAWLAKELSTLVSLPKAKIGAVVYPGLPTHPAYFLIKRYSFAGSSLVLTAKEGAVSARYLKSLVGKLIAEAKRMQVSLVAGSSFGLNVTRVYLVAMKNEYSAPFLRVSVGTETMMEMEQLLKVFKKVLS